MAKIESAFFEVDYLERLSYMDTPIHRLDPRTRLITTLLFVVMVVSFDKYEISGLLLFSLYPLTLAVLGNIPLLYLLKKILIVAPFAVLVGIFNPVFDKEIIVNLGGFGISGGWISFISIILRFILTISSAFILIATSGLLGVCLALEKMGVPKIFAVQLLFLYRYIFVLIDEAQQVIRARALRSFNGKGMGIKVAGSMIGHLLLRTISRARRIHLAMLSRGFDGDIHLMRSVKFSFKDLVFIFSWGAVFILFRYYNIPQLMGRFITGAIR